QVWGGSGNARNRTRPTMNEALKNTGSHGGSDSAGRSFPASSTPGKQTLTESLGEASTHEGAAPAPGPPQAAPHPPAALHAVSMGAVASSFASSGADVAGQVGSSLPTVQRKSAADVAEGGFAGGGHEVPHRQEMEKSFGMDFSHVRAHSDSPATKAND